MKISWEIIIGLFCVSIHPTIAHYIYNGDANVGFVIQNSETYVPASTMQKKQFTGKYGSRYQKYSNEQVVDSHFKLMKSSSCYVIPSIDKSVLSKDYRMTAAPKIWQNTVKVMIPSNSQKQMNEEQNRPKNSPKMIQNKPVNISPPKLNYMVDLQRIDKKPDLSKNDSILPPIRPRAIKSEFTSPIKQNLRSQVDTFEAKANYVIHKSQISQELQRLMLNNKRQLTASSVFQSPNLQQRTFSIMTEKISQKSNGRLKQQNSHILSPVFDDVDNQITDTQIKGQYRKRDTRKLIDFYNKSKRSENSRKFIGKNKPGNKERHEKTINNLEIRRNHEDETSSVVSQMPYALFYRMNSENLDHQDPFTLLKSTESYDNKEIRIKEITPPSDIEIIKKKSISNSLRIHRKIRSFHDK